MIAYSASLAPEFHVEDVDEFICGGGQAYLLSYPKAPRGPPKAPSELIFPHAHPGTAHVSPVILETNLQYLLSRSADPDVVNTVGETADRVSGAGPEAFQLLQEARRRKRGTHGNA